MTADQLNRPSANPGGMECQTCGRIFIGDESHSECGICHNTRPTAVASSPVEAIGVASRNEADGGNKEAVAWQYRVQGKPWRTVSKSTFDKYRDGSNYEWRELFTHPPRSGDEARDAARYRWLRDKSVHFELPDRGTPYCVYGLGMGDSNPTWGTELDAMVDYCMSPDAAMAARGDDK